MEFLAAGSRGELPGEPDGLELGAIELAAGTWSLGMILRRPYPAHPELTDISGLSSWRAYRVQP